NRRAGGGGKGVNSGGAGTFKKKKKGRTGMELLYNLQKRQLSLRQYDIDVYIDTRQGNRRSKRGGRAARCQLLVFFSSRRRHTIFKCDWSSDVCSSDLSPVSAVIATRLKPGTEAAYRAWEQR